MTALLMLYLSIIYCNGSLKKMMHDAECGVRKTKTSTELYGMKVIWYVMVFIHGKFFSKYYKIIKERLIIAY